MRKCDICYNKLADTENTYGLLISFENGDCKNEKEICLNCLQKIESFIASLITVK